MRMTASRKKKEHLKTQIKAAESIELSVSDSQSLLGIKPEFGKLGAILNKLGGSFAAAESNDDLSEAAASSVEKGQW